MRYYKLLLDDSNQNDILCYCEDSYGFEQYHLNEGKWIKNWDEDLTFCFNRSEGSRETDYLANDLGWFVVSSKFKSLLQELDKNEIQFLPVTVVNRENNCLLEGYSVANVLSVLDVLNLDYSDYNVFELDDEKVYSIRKYAINQNKVTGFHIFKNKGAEIPIFVSEVFKEMVRTI